MSTGTAEATLECREPTLSMHVKCLAYARELIMAFKMIYYYLGPLQHTPPQSQQ